MTEPVLRVGCSAGCGLQLPGDSVDPTALFWIAGRTYAVRTSRQRRQPTRVISGWMSIDTKSRWGDWSVLLEGLPAGPEPSMRSPFREPQLWLDWSAGGPLAPTRLAQALTLIGSAEGCDIRLAATGVQPLHAALVHTANALWLVDLSDTGTPVNEQAVEFARLDPGDMIQFGSVHVQLTLRWQTDLQGHPLIPVVTPPAEPQHDPASPSSKNAIDLDQREQLEQYVREQRARLSQLEQFVQRGRAHPDVTAATLGRSRASDGVPHTPAALTERPTPTQ